MSGIDPDHPDYENWLWDRIRAMLDRALPAYDGRIRFATLTGEEHQVSFTLPAPVADAINVKGMIEADAQVQLLAITGDRDDTTYTVAPRGGR
ncbi:MAG: hypothetical protein AAGG38_00355 [Planctomycetota bacterium]